MTKTRKTLDRTNVIARANAALGSDISTDVKVGIFVVTSGMLTTGNAYKGFRALRESKPDVYDAWADGHFDTYEAMRLGMEVRFL